MAAQRTPVAQSTPAGGGRIGLAGDSLHYWQMLRVLSRRYTLAVISDTGFASGRAQDRLLEKDAARGFFASTIYSMDVGHAKPRAEIFHAAVSALGLVAGDILHIGDNERTDVRGALAAGFRAIRIDVVRDSGPSEAEFVARSFEELSAYLLKQTLTTK